MVNRLSDAEKKSVNDNLGVLRIVYGSSFSLGYFQLGIGFPVEFLNIQTWISVLIPAALVFLSVRFYWAIGVIRKYIFSSDETRKEHTGRMVMAVHVPILLLHSFCFYLMCRYYEIAFDRFGAVQNGQILNKFVIVYLFLLYLNAAWLAVCILLPDLKSNIWSKPNFWIFNNVAFASAALLVYALMGLDGGGLFIIVLLFLFNSLIDLYVSGDLYIFGSPG